MAKKLKSIGTIQSTGTIQVGPEKIHESSEFEKAIQLSKIVERGTYRRVSMESRYLGYKRKNGTSYVLKVGYQFYGAKIQVELVGGVYAFGIETSSIEAMSLTF